jgi:hypothetical protein
MAVHVQMTLLSYAASTQHVSEIGCAIFLRCRGFDKKKAGRSDKIASWIWGAKPRHENLEGFAQGPAEEKRALVEKFRRDIHQLFKKSPTGTISAFKAENTWQEKGANFLRAFYDDLNDSKLPACYFLDSSAGDFRRQDFLRAFFKENGTLHVCPVCDESGSYTSSGGKVRTDIEHYFPQRWYPHFACHPFNLIPICHICNAAVHGDKDPLQLTKNRRLELQDIVLPYRGRGLGTVTRLKVELNEKQSATFQDLVSIDENNYDTQICMLKMMYNIPNRWNKDERIDKVGEALFRRMRQFLRGSYELSGGDSLRPVLWNALHQLVYFLHTSSGKHYEGGDYGKDPFAFAMKWLLVEILREEEQHIKVATEESLTIAEPFSLPLLCELAKWLGQDVKSSDEYAAVAAMLIRLASDESSVEAT